MTAISKLNMSEFTAGRVLELCKVRGYVPEACTLDGIIVLIEHRRGIDPCAGCNVPREQCGGRPKYNGNFSTL